MLWRLIARICALPRVADWLIARAQRTPYTPIMSPDGQTLYMGRWWLFNPYDERKLWAWLPSVRVHHICVEDQDRHHHTHPWNCRTIILRGGYLEERPGETGNTIRSRRAGDTARIKHYDLHRISHVCEGGAWTLFITGRYRKTWGFLVPWREYLGVDGGDLKDVEDLRKELLLSPAKSNFTFTRDELIKLVGL